MLKKVTKPIRAWHFLYSGHRTRPVSRSHEHENVQVWPGTVLTMSRPDDVYVCTYGLHGSRRLAHAHAYAPEQEMGKPLWLSRVEIGGVVDEMSDKLAGSERRVLWVVNASEPFKALRPHVRWTNAMYTAAVLAYVDALNPNVLDKQDKALLRRLLREGK